MSERTTSWLEHERTLAVWMHGASSRAPVFHVLRHVSRLGDGWLWLMIGLVLPLVSPEHGLACLARMVAVGAVNLLLYLVIKRFVARPRPYHCCPGIEARTKSLDEFSFPSGHALHAVAFSIILDAYFPHLAWVMWPTVVLIAASRVILGLHFVSDVLVGVAIGVVTATASFNFF
jgi:undecaprenyl-diphosphatase